MTQQLLRPAPGAWRRILGVLAVLVVAGMGVYYTNRVEGRLECQARYNEVNNERSRALAEAADKERQAERAEKIARAALFTHPAILTPAANRTPGAREEMRKLAVAWQHALAEEQKQQAAADAERQEHPVPPPPSTTCGD